MLSTLLFTRPIALLVSCACATAVASVPAHAAALAPLRGGSASPRRAPSRADELIPYIAANRIVMPSSAEVRAMRAAHAMLIPSFSRQTKLACSVCHYAFPQLTPFGRLFKLNGYTLTGLVPIAGGDTSHPTLKLAPIPPAAAMMIASLTNTGAAVPGTQNNTALLPDQLSVFLGGEVTPKVGAFVQLTYSGQDGSIGIDNTEFRFANHTTLGAKDLLYGVTLHNNPTMQDVWNTTPAWGFPFASSGVAPSAIASPIIDGALGQQVLGVGAYGLWNRTVYGEFTAYRSAPQGGPAPLDSTATGVGRNMMPYWRLALQHQFGTTYGMAGMYGMVANLYPTGVVGPVNRFTDVGLDAQLEHPMGAGVLIARSTWLHERQNLNALASADPRGAANRTDALDVFRVNASYMPNTRLTLSLGYFSTTGTADSVLYTPASVVGSRTSSPNTNGAIGELDFNAWQNTRLGAQYTVYGRFNGASTSYDGSGRSASDNNTLFLFAWVAF